MARFARLAAGILSAAALVVVASPARADSAAGASRAASCEARIGGLTATGVQIPSNAPALLLIDPQPYDYALPSTVSAELVTTDKRVPFAAPARDANGINALTLPSLSEGSYRISVTANCSGYTPSPAEVPLVLTGAVPLPTAVGKLVEIPQNPPTGVTNFELEPGTNVRAFLPVIQFWTTIDGVKAAATAGAPSTSPISFSAKTGQVCVENGALHREKRTVKVSVGAAIAGVAQPLADATVDVTVDCGAIKWTKASDFANEEDGTTTTTTTPAPGGSSSTGGCSASPSARTSAATALFVVAGLGALVAVRRRRRRA